MDLFDSTEPGMEFIVDDPSKERSLRSLASRRRVSHNQVFTVRQVTNRAGAVTGILVYRVK